MPKPVAVILLNWNTPQHTIACIASLQQYCNIALFDIIVADNGSTDDSLAIIKAQYPDLIYIDNKENLGFAEGNNRALVYSIDQGYAYSLVMNNDTLVDEDIVSKLSTHLNQHPTTAAVQPNIYWLHNKTEIWNGEGKFNALLGSVSSPALPTNFTAEYKKVEWVTGCGMLLRNSALQKSGLFNKQFFLYYEDVELSFRLRKNGFELHLLQGCKMYHEAGVSAKKQPAKKEGNLSPIIHYYTCRNLFWFLRRYGNPVLYPVNLLFNATYYLLVFMYFKLRGRKQKAGFVIKGLKDGIFKPKNLIWPEY